jgi:hypothetical protein
MSQENKVGANSVLSYLNLSSHYERKARLLPGLLCAMTLIPVGAAFGTPFGDWIGLATTGLGLWAVCGVGLSHLSSAAGNRLQEKLWPRWPYDAPTNRWLHPDDRTGSSQQKRLMNEAIKRLTNLDIEGAVEQGPEELEAVLNDCVTRLRYQLRNSPHGDRLDSHNADYGFARNFAGLRPLWLTFLVLSAAGCWIGYARFGCAPIWCAVSTVLAMVAIPLSLGLYRYVRVRARHYSESFFSAVTELDRAEHKTERSDAEICKPKKASTRKRASGPEAK